MRYQQILQWLSARPKLLGLLTVACLGLSGNLLMQHASLVSEVRDVSLPLAERIPALEQRLSILQQQAELSELQEALRVGSQEEHVHVYALPTETDFARVVTLFQEFMEAMEKGNLASDFAPITIGNEEPTTDGYSVQPLHLETTLHSDGLKQLLSLVELSGLLTVGDALTPDERSLLLTQTETENPAGVVALEQFLSTPLLTYILEPRPMEDQLLRSFSGPAFEQTLRSVTQGSLLRDARRLLEGGFGRTLDQQNLWPLQFMTVRSMDLASGSSEGWQRVTLELDLWLRTNEKK